MIFSKEYFGEHLDTDIEHYFVIGHFMYLVPFKETLINNQNRLLAIRFPLLLLFVITIPTPPTKTLELIITYMKNIREERHRKTTVIQST